jgi:flagellar motor switch protein FliM
MHENFARLVANFLSVYLRTNVQIKIISVEQLTFEDFIVSIPTPTLMAIFSMDPLSGSAVLETNSNFVFPLIDLLFGGPGNMPGKVRELTDIESNVLKHLYGRLLENLNYVWSDVYEISTTIQGVETNPQLNRIISPNEIVAVVTFSTAINGHEGMMNICLPFVTLGPVVSKLSARHWFSSEQGTYENYQKLIEEALGQTPVTLTALGGETELTVREFLGLQPGDVVTLDSRIGQDMILAVDDRPKYRVQPGIHHEKLAVQVTGVLERGEKVE